MSIAGGGGLRLLVLVCAVASRLAQASAAAAGLPAFVGDAQLTAAMRYWYSSEQIRYGFSNRNPRAGDPTSLLDWTGLDARSGEILLQALHRPTGLFLKMLGGLGEIGGGRLLDRDFRAGQVSFSATSSRVEQGRLDYGIVDVGYEFAPFPALLPRLETAPFVGYHHWDGSPVSSGVYCEASDVPRKDCSASTTGVLYASDVKALGYATRWDALRLGLGLSVPLFDKLSVRAEAAWVPVARFAVDDSHYLRQSSDPRLGIGPVPNVFIRGVGRGVELEAFLDYRVGASFTLGAGGRYWGLAATDGTVRNRLSTTENPVTTYDQERYGLLVEARYGF